MGAEIRASGITHWFESKARAAARAVDAYPALAKVDLTVAAGEFVTLVGARTER